MTRSTLVLFLTGCVAQAEPAQESETVDASTGDIEPQAPAPRVCELDVGEPQALAVHAGGLALWDGAVVERLHGQGCALAPIGGEVAAAGLFGADDRGTIYVAPAPADDGGAIATMLPDALPGGSVAAVDLADRVAAVVLAPRGIWGFGSAPSGDALWVTACGPTGVFTRTDQGLAPVFPSPATLWEQLPSVMSDDATLWSVGVRTCVGTAELDRDCGYALSRTTAAGTRTFASLVGEGDAGLELATLAPCGPEICGVGSRTIRRWDLEGRELVPLDATALALADDATIVQAAGNAAGIYVLSRAPDATHVVFVASVR